MAAALAKSLVNAADCMRFSLRAKDFTYLRSHVEPRSSTGEQRILDSSVALAMQVISKFGPRCGLNRIAHSQACGGSNIDSVQKLKQSTHSVLVPDHDSVHARGLQRTCSTVNTVVTQRHLPRSKGVGLARAGHLPRSY